MYSLFVGFLTVILVLDALFLILLVLIQLPKKEAGMGTAFGGGMTDALFGAGTGNVLTKATKWSAGIFLVMSLLLSILNANQVGKARKLRDQQLLTRDPAAQIAVPPAASNTLPPAGVPVIPAAPAAATAAPAPAPAAATATPATPPAQAPAPSAPATPPPAGGKK